MVSASSSASRTWLEDELELQLEDIYYSQCGCCWEQSFQQYLLWTQKDRASLRDARRRKWRIDFIFLWTTPQPLLMLFHQILCFSPSHDSASQFPPSFRFLRNKMFSGTFIDSRSNEISYSEKKASQQTWCWTASQEVIRLPLSLFHLSYKENS